MAIPWCCVLFASISNGDSPLWTGSEYDWRGIFRTHPGLFMPCHSQASCLSLCRVTLAQSVQSFRGGLQIIQRSLDSSKNSGSSEISLNSDSSPSALTLTPVGDSSPPGPLCFVPSSSTLALVCRFVSYLPLIHLPSLLNEASHVAS